MRRANFIYLIIAISIILISCNKEENSTDLPEWSKIYALKNGIEWETSCYARINPLFHEDSLIISAQVSNEFGYTRESLTISNIPNLIGRYDINSSLDHSILHSYYVTISDDGDVVEDSFIVLEGPKSYIIVDIYDKDGKEFSGSFEITFIRNPNDNITNPNLPDTIVFSNGVFQAKIID